MSTTTTEQVWTLGALLDWTAKHLAGKPHIDTPRIVDIGVGSGNLAIAIAKHHPTAVVIAIDKSAEALKIAQDNAAKHGVAERIRFLQGDLFAPLADGEQFHFIVSNPPYIAD